MEGVHKALDKLEKQVLGRRESKQHLTFREVLARVAEEYTNAADCERRYPELFRDLEEACWRENPRDVTDAIVDYETPIALSLHDEHEIGRIVAGAMRRYVHKELDRAIRIAHDEYLIRMGFKS